LNELQSALPVKCLPVPGDELNILLMCVVPLMVPILSSTEHLRKFVSSIVRKCIDLSNTRYGWNHQMFYFIGISGRTCCVIG
jgi:hypothetical protein